MTPGEEALQRASVSSQNRHWLARLILGAWTWQVPMAALLAPESLAGRALELTGGMGYLMMSVLLVLGSLALMDSGISDLLPERFTSRLERYRHVGFMLLSLALVITGGGIAHVTNAPVVLVSFLLPAFFCVVVTAADLYSRHLGSRP